MPYNWLPHTPTETRLDLWPHRSLPPQGFVWFIGITVALIALPLVSLLGSSALWVVLPFVVLMVAGVWFALRRSYRDAAILEVLTLTPNLATLTRQGPHGQHQTWSANPHWVRVVLHPIAGPVPNYLTLQGGPREVELGAFLSDAERLALRDEVQTALARVR